jgi:F0F1-type ATP synthase membrane subunit c/vacuolar-type H+-ATPase subunit K
LIIFYLLKKYIISFKASRLAKKIRNIKIVFFYMILLQGAKFLGAGLSTISLAGSGVGIGIVFAALIISMACTLSLGSLVFTLFFSNKIINKNFKFVGNILKKLLFYQIIKNKNPSILEH